MTHPSAPTRRRRSHLIMAAAACVTVGLSTMVATTATAAPTAPSTSPSTQQAQAVTTDQLIIGYESNVTDAAQTAAVAAVEDATGAAVEAVAETGTGGQVVETAAELSAAETQEVIAAIEQVEGVAYVEADAMLTIDQTNDPQYPSLWGLHGTNGMDVPAAWPTSRGDGAVVAVIDTGITAHPDLDANVLPGYDFVSDATAARDGDARDANPADQGDWYDAGECNRATGRVSSWHGSHVAGTVAAIDDNSVGIAGVAPDAQIVPVRVLAKCGGRSSDISDGIIWAAGGTVPGVPVNANPADVINLSLGGAGTCSRTTQAAINGAVAAGATVVVAAGNDDVNASGFQPANCANVITVAASDIGGNRAFYSNFGTTIEVTAPGGETAVRGEGILSTVNASTTSPTSAAYAYSQGTSMAAPHVAGVAAILSQTEPDLTPAQISQRLRDTATPVPGTCSGGCGSGIVDAAAAIG